MVLKDESRQKLNAAIKMTSEEFFQCHLNIINYFKGHIFVRYEKFIKKIKKTIRTIKLCFTYNHKEVKEHKMDEMNLSASLVI